MQDDVISFKQGSSSFFMPFLWKISLLTTMLSDGWFNHFATTKPPERLSGCWAFSSRRWFIWGCWTMRWNAWKFHIAYQAIQTPALACSYSFPNPSSSSFTKPAPGTSRTSGGRKVQFPVGILSLANKEGNYICMLHSRKLAIPPPWKSSAAWNTPPGKAGFRIFLRPSKFWGWFFLSYCTVS